MKKVISELLKENFSYRPEKLCLSEKKIEGDVPEGRRFAGRFAISCASGQVQGFLYSTNPRVTCFPEFFVGFRAEITFEVSTEGMREGDSLEGAFVICAPSGEYTLPYCLRIRREAGRETAQPLRFTPKEFAGLAREDFARAYALFASRQFPEILKTWEPSCLPLYEGTAEGGLSFHSLEQFLVGLGQKEPMSVSLEKDSIYLDSAAKSEREKVLLTKNTWGFARLSISCDAPFLTVERPEVTTEEFVGSTYSLGFVIRREKLHAGRNFARIRIVTECKELICTVEIRKEPQSAPDGSARRLRQEILRLMGAYIDFRAGRTGEKEWSGISLVCLDNIKKAGGRDIFFDLYRAYILFQTGALVEAQLVTGELAARKEELAKPQWKGVYLYLTTLESADKDYLEYVRDEIRSLHLSNQENWILQWLMLRVNENMYRNDAERLDAIRRQYARGCVSPVMYLEAWEIIRREPLMLRGLEEFEIHLLAFLAKEKLLNREICGQAASCCARLSSCHPLLCRVLMRSFSQFPSRNLLAAICSLLMKGHRDGPEYAGWFELGVRQDIRLAGLYEYYAQTVEDLNVRLLPQAVQMYFSYNNTLSYGKKAALYANIVRGRTRDAQTFETYRPSIERFLEEQLQAGRINEDLAFLYDALLTRYILGEHLAEGLSKVLFAHEIVCKNPYIRHAVVIHGRLKEEQRVPFADGRACVQICDPGCSILLEDKNGVLYADPSLYSVRRLLTRTDLENFCRSQGAVPKSLLLHDLAGAEVTDENAGLFVQLMGLPGIRPDCRRETERRLLSYFGKNPNQRYLPEFLGQADLEELAGDSMEELTELLVSEGLARQAMELVRKNGAEHVEARTLVRLCSYCIAEQEQERDEHLTALCARCFEQGVYDEAVLKYLMRWYEGPVGIMRALWEAGREFDLEEFSLEEKILACVLYMKCHMEQTEPIFASYVRKQGNARLCRAYVIWMSYCYFVKEARVGQPVFDYIEKKVLREINQPQICQLALLRFYCMSDQLSESRRKWLSYLLDKFTAKGMYFRFYQRLPVRLLRRFHLHDKYILEYRADPHSYVVLHYSLNGGREQKVSMNHVYEGIFVKTFTLFYHDSLEWHWSVEQKNGTFQTARQTIVCGRRSHRGSTERYELINLLAEAQSKKNKEQIRKIREQYIGQQYLVEELFDIQ